MTPAAAQPVCYLTTVGRVSGREHIVEIWYVELDGCIYLMAGSGERADWVRNLQADPSALVSFPQRAELTPPVRHTATIGPFPDEISVRRAMETRYYGWQPGQPLSQWGTTALVVRLCRQRAVGESATAGA